MWWCTCSGSRCAPSTTSRRSGRLTLRAATSAWPAPPARSNRPSGLRIVLAAIGRLGRTPETDLARDWAERATVQGRAMGLGPVEIIEVEPRKPGKAAEGLALLDAV